MTVHIQTDDEAAALVDWAKVAHVEPRVPSLLENGRTRHADRLALVFDDQRLTYRDADARSALLARHLLDAGVGKGTRVGMIFPNSPEFVVTWLAVTRIGAVVVPMSTFSSADEIGRMVRHSDIALLLTTDRYLSHDYGAKLETAFDELPASTTPLRLAAAPYLRAIWMWPTADAAPVPTWARAVDLDEPPDATAELLAAIEDRVMPSDLITIIYTSGSTAEPKGVIHTQGSIVRQGAKVAATFPYHHDDRVLTPMPFFWVGGLTLNLLSVLHVGAALVATSATDPDSMLDFIERERVSYLMCWPHTARALAAHPGFADRDLTAMRGGQLREAVPSEYQVDPWVAFGQALGMTETCGPHTIAHFRHPESLAGTFGTPMPGMALRLIDPETSEPVPDGEIGILQVRGDCLMQGMVGREREEVFTDDGWYTTSDLCSFVDRHLFFHGRADDLIKTAGSNVAPGEVEVVLRAIDGVNAAHVTGVPDPDRGSVVGAVVVPDAGCEIDPADVVRTAAAHLSSYKVPKVVLVIPPGDLPMMSSGKVDRRALFAALVDQHASAGAGTR